MEARRKLEEENQKKREKEEAKARVSEHSHLKETIFVSLFKCDM